MNEKEYTIYLNLDKIKGALKGKVIKQSARIKNGAWWWWHMPLILPLWRQKQMGLCDVEIGLVS